MILSDDLVFVRCGTDQVGTDHRTRAGRAGLHTVRPHLHLRSRLAVCGEADLVEITEEYRVVRGTVVRGSSSPSSGARVSEIVMFLLLVLVILQVVAVDLA